MPESSWPALEVMQEHLQHLVSQRYMVVAELATCCLPKDYASPAPAGGYVVACMAFYERGFGVPSHRFLRSLLRSYGLELHHLTPSGILHMVAFMTLYIRPRWGWPRSSKLRLPGSSTGPQHTKLSERPNPPKRLVQWGKRWLSLLKWLPPLKLSKVGLF
jgi:hypothetical protein